MAVKIQGCFNMGGSDFSRRSSSVGWSVQSPSGRIVGYVEPKGY